MGFQKGGFWGGVWILSDISRSKHYLAKLFEVGLLLYISQGGLSDFGHIFGQTFFRASESSKVRDP